MTLGIHDKMTEKNKKIGDITPDSTQPVDVSNASMENEKENRPLTVDLSPKRRGLRIARNTVLIGGCLFIVLLIASGLYAYQFTNSNIIDKEDQEGFFAQIHRIINDDVEPLKGEENDLINVLMLGQGGLDHPGGTLADTIMIASIQPSTNKVSLMSLPRDLVIPYYPNGTSSYVEYRKINYVLELGGIDFAKQTIKDVTGLDINYYAIVDFTGFRDVIDTLGGLDIYVDNGFTDYQYPDYNYGFQTISFTEGWTHMDGEMALQYSRSRHGNNGEGSDFKRARRQQKILEATKDKLLSASTFLNPGKLNGLLSNLGDHITTDTEIWELLRFAQLAENINEESIINTVVDNGPEGILHSEISSETGAYVLIPDAGLGDFSDIQQLALNAFNLEIIEVEQSTVAVQNGTALNGYAGQTAQQLRSLGLEIGPIGNALVKNVPETIIYDLSGGTKPNTVLQLEQQLHATVVRATIPKSTDSPIRLATDLNGKIVDLSVLDENVDFIVVLGQSIGTIQAATDGEETDTLNNGV
ncbi:MAG: LCP family protein [Candidatus Kerfeldbacteria bacterium]